MNRAFRSALAVPLCALLLGGSTPQGQGDTLIVTLKQTRLRAAKRLFAPAVAELHEGDRVGFVAKDGAWLNVKFDAVAGWLHETDVTANKDVRLSGEGVRETYSASETGAARKGFNPQIERESRQNNPSLNVAFAIVDEIQARKVSEDEIRTFLQEGGLWQEGVR